MHALPGIEVPEGKNPLTSLIEHLNQTHHVNLEAITPLKLLDRVSQFRDPRQNRQTTPFFYYLDSKIQLHQDTKLKWYKLENLPLLAFDHGAIICEALSLWWKGIPPHSSSPFPTPQFDLSTKKEITFFGGSFNPLHEGHLECIRQFNDPENLIVVPDNKPL